MYFLLEKGGFSLQCFFTRRYAYVYCIYIMYIDIQRVYKYIYIYTLTCLVVLPRVHSRSTTLIFAHWLQPPGHLAPTLSLPFLVVQPGLGPFTKVINKLQILRSRNPYRNPKSKPKWCFFFSWISFPSWKNMRISGITRVWGYEVLQVDLPSSRWIWYIKELLVVEWTSQPNVSRKGPLDVLFLGWAVWMGFLPPENR